MKRIRKAILALVLVFSFAVPLPVGATMNGIDVSSWQSGIEVDQVQGVEFVITKPRRGQVMSTPTATEYTGTQKTAAKKSACIISPAVAMLSQRRSILSTMSADT